MQEKAEAHNQRYEEYAAKQRLLQKRQEDFKRRVPKILLRLDAEFENLLKSCRKKSSCHQI